MSEPAKKKQVPWNKGKKTGHTPWNKGKKHSPETRAKLSKARRARPPASVETRAKLSAALKGRARPQEVVDRIRATHEERGIVPPRSSQWGHQSVMKDSDGSYVSLLSSVEKSYLKNRLEQGVRIRAYDPKVDGVRTYLFEGKQRRYIPDFVEVHGGVEVLVEVKASNNVEEVVAYENRVKPGRRAGDKTRMKLLANPDVLLVSPFTGPPVTRAR